MLTVDKLKDIVNLCLEVDSGRTLPPPSSARKKLQETFALTIRKWCKDFSKGYKKLEVGMEYLQRVKGVSFDANEPSSAVERRRKEQRLAKSEAIWRERAKQVEEEMNREGPGSARLEARECLTQLDNCLTLLMPNLLEDEEDDEVVDPRLHGVVNSSATIVTVDLGEKMKIDVNEDNSAVVQNLRDQYRLLMRRLIPTAKRWTATLSRANGYSQALK